MTEYEPPPDLTNPTPPQGWKRDQWVAARVISDGGTHQDAATRAGVARNTISTWKRKWRTRYGPDFLKGTPGRKSHSPRSLLVDHPKRIQWAELRTVAAAANAETADMARELAGKILRRYLDDPALMAELKIRDVVDLALVADKLERSADRLLDPLTREIQNGQSPPIGPPQGILAALDGGEQLASSEVLDMAEQVAGTYLSLVGGVVEVDGRQVS